MWPFAKRENRQRISYADAIVAAAEAAAGIVGRALAAASVTPATAAVTADVLHTAGRELVTRGEWIGRLAFRRGALRLDPVAHWDVHGATPDEETWFVQPDADGAFGLARDPRDGGQRRSPALVDSKPGALARARAAARGQSHRPGACRNRARAWG